MYPKQMSREQHAVAIGVASMVWLVVGVVCTLIGLVAAILQLSVANFVGGLVCGFVVGGFFAWLVWFSFVYLTPAGRAHQAWNREQAAALAASRPQPQRQQVVYGGGYANNNDLAVATGLIVGGLYGLQSEIAYLSHPPRHEVVNAGLDAAYRRNETYLRDRMFGLY